MKINRIFIYTVFIISALLILLTGCFVAPTEPPVTYTLTYNGNTNTGGAVPVDANLYEEGALVTALGNTGILVKTGYSFDGWNTAADGSGTDYDALDAFTIGTANMTLFAQWKENMGGVCQPCPSVPTYKVTFNKDDDSATGTMADQIIASGESTNLTANAFILAGHTFLGWAETSGGPVVYADMASYTMGTADVTLYAKWALDVELVANFETCDFSGWEVTTAGSFPQVQGAQIHSGSCAAYMGDGDGGLGGGNTASIQQTINIPSDAVNPELSIYYRVVNTDWWEGCDWMKFYINGTQIFYAWIDSSGWQEFQYDLSAYTGSSIDLKISAWTSDSIEPVNYYVDDITITWD